MITGVANCVIGVLEFVVGLWPMHLLGCLYCKCLVGLV